MRKKVGNTKSLNVHVKKAHEIPCQWCEKVASVEICGKCREINKFKMVEILLEMDKVCLLYSHINKDGRPKKRWDKTELAEIMESYNQTQIIRKTARDLGKSKSYIATAINYVESNSLA